MAKDDRSVWNGAVSKGDIAEAIVDLCSGALMLFLFGPFVYALKYFLPGANPPSYQALLVGIFPSFAQIFSGASLSSATPWMLLGLSVILAFISRGVFMLYHTIPLTGWLERLLAWWAWRQISRWHGFSQWNLKDVKRRLVDGNPFDKVGTTGYARYRAALLDPLDPLSRSGAYWDYEKFLYIRASHFFGLFLTFASLYCVYGMAVFSLGTLARIPFDGTALLLWFATLGVALAVAMGLMQEVFIHGIAFIAIDDDLFTLFAQTRSP